MLVVLSQISNSLSVECEFVEWIQVLVQDGDHNDNVLTREFAYVTIHSGKPDRWIKWRPDKFVSLLCSIAAVSYLPSCIPGNCDEFGKDKAILLFSPLYLPVVFLSFDAIMKILSTVILIKNTNKSVVILLSLGAWKYNLYDSILAALLESYKVFCHSIYKKSDLHLIKGFLIQVHGCAWPLRCLHKNLLTCLTLMSHRWMSYYHANGVSSFLRLIVTKQERDLL